MLSKTSIVVLRRCLPLRRSSRDPQLMKGWWSVDGGIDYLKSDADVNGSIVAQNFLMVKMAGRSFGRKKTTVWLSPCRLSHGGLMMCWGWLLCNTDEFVQSHFSDGNLILYAIPCQPHYFLPGIIKDTAGTFWYFLVGIVVHRYVSE
jgi:hypothetical protein